MSRRLDFPQSVPLRKSYIIASSYRCGSTFFCSQLWRTGVLGAPAEYLNMGASRMRRDDMMRRLRAKSPESYFTRLLARRTSKNGVFGMKVHFAHFEAALNWYPSMLDVLSPVTYIHLERKDKLAQAVSMAKAIQTDAWQSLDRNKRTPLVYNDAFIAQCLRDIQQENFGWLRWFEAKKIQPVTVYYEDVLAYTASTVRSIIARLDAGKDEPEQVSLPLIEKQADETSSEWLTRFRRERDPWLELDGGYGGMVAGWVS